MWWRRLLPLERDFVRLHFGAEQGDWLAQHIRLGVRRLGDTRRALCLNGGWMSLPRACFVQGDGAQALRLSHPQVAGLLAHELLHQLQRRHGLPVTRQALVLHTRHLIGGVDPYCYSACRNPRALLRQFWHANVEQQAQMWQDHVQSAVAGQPEASLALVAQAVRAGRLRRGMAQK